MRKSGTYRLVLAAFAWLLPIGVIPAACFAISQACFLWSPIALGLTLWRVWNSSGTRDSAELSRTVSLSHAITRLALVTSAVQTLAFLWLGAFWVLQSAGHLVLRLAPASHALGWIQSHWFSGALFWFLLFAIVGGLFRLGRPVLERHCAAVNLLADAIRQRRRAAAEVAEGT